MSTAITAPKSIIFYPNGNVSAFDSEGNQIPELQNVGWMQAYFNHLESLGINPAIVMYSAMMNDGNYKTITTNKTENGWSVIINHK